MIPITEQEHNKRIGKAIFYFRTNYKNPDKRTPGLTQTQLAQRIFVTFQQVQKYEKGTNGTSGYRILQIAEALRINISDIFVKAYEDKSEILSFCTPFETIKEIPIDEKPLILKKEWIIDEKKQD